MAEISLDQILNENDSDGSVTHGCTLTVWIPVEHKAAYDRLQKETRRRFSKKLRKIVLTAIEMSEKQPT